VELNVVKYWIFEGKYMQVPMLTFWVAFKNLDQVSFFKCPDFDLIASKLTVLWC
jgi:hypothetical protein